jgi:hypothetical protein
VRTLSSILVGVLALVALCVFFILHSVLSYIEDPDAVTETARGEALHERVLDLADIIIEDEMRSAGLYGEELRAFVKTEARQAFGEVFAPDWFYRAFHDAYAGALAIVHDRRPEPVDLRDRKQALGDGLEGVAGKVMEHCRELIGTPSCADPDSRRRMLMPVTGAVRRAVDDIPDALEVETIAARAGAEWLRTDSRQMARARQALRIARVAKSISLGALLLFFLVIGVSNRAPLGRMLIALGLVIGLTSAGYIVGLQVADAKMREPIELALAEVNTRARTSDPTVGSVALEGTSDWSRAVAHDAIHGSDTMVIGLGGVGIVLVVIGVLVYRRPRAG